MVKNYYEALSKDEKRLEEFKSFFNETDTAEDREKIIAEKVIPQAKEMGFDLSADDFKQEHGELSDAELEKVSGGIGDHPFSCTCIYSGSGAGKGDNGLSYRCRCSNCGQGADGHSPYGRCSCTFFGIGGDEYTKPISN